MDIPYGADMSLEAIKYHYYMGTGVEYYIDYAIMHSQCDVVDWLIPKMISDGFNCDDLMPVACISGDINIFNTMIENGVSIDEECVFEACEHGHKDILLQLYILGVDINKQDEGGWNALYFAIDHGYLEIADILLDWNVPQIPSTLGTYPLTIACIKGDVEAIKLLSKYSITTEMIQSVTNSVYQVTPEIKALISQLPISQ